MAHHGDFDSLGVSEANSKVLTPVFRALNNMGWDWAKNEMTPEDRKTSPEYSKLRELAQQYAYVSYTDTTFWWAMETMLVIAKDGWDSYAKATARRIKESAEWDRKMREMERCYGRDDW
jgi:hypothetical protein